MLSISKAFKFIPIRPLPVFVYICENLYLDDEISFDNFILLLFFVPVLLSQKKTVIPDGEFEEQVTKTGVQVLDVRTAGEYAASHIKHSLQADWLNNKQFKERVQYLDKAHPVYVYCGSGVRSNDAAKWLRQEGFQQVFELQNGIISWKKNNRPVEIDSAVNQMSLAEYQAP